MYSTGIGKSLFGRRGWLEKWHGWRKCAHSILDPSWSRGKFQLRLGREVLVGVQNLAGFLFSNPVI